MWFEQSYTGRGHYCGDPISGIAAAEGLESSEHAPNAHLFARCYRSFGPDGTCVTDGNRALRVHPNITDDAGRRRVIDRGWRVACVSKLFRDPARRALCDGDKASDPD